MGNFGQQGNLPQQTATPGGSGGSNLYQSLLGMGSGAGGGGMQNQFWANGGPGGMPGMFGQPPGAGQVIPGVTNQQPYNPSLNPYGNSPTPGTIGGGGVMQNPQQGNMWANGGLGPFQQQLGGGGGGNMGAPQRTGPAPQQPSPQPQSPTSYLIPNQQPSPTQGVQRPGWNFRG